MTSSSPGDPGRPARPGSDLRAGLVTAVVLVPQAMAYAALAGVPPVVGLYAGVLPLLAYALAGSAPRLAVGPVALMAMMTADAVAPLASPGGAGHLARVAALSLLVGAVQLAFGVARLGFLARLLPHAVVTGFVTGVALRIAASQLGPLVGVAVPRGAGPGRTLVALGGAAPGPALVGLVFVAGTLLVRRRLPSVPAPVLAVVAGLAVGGTGLVPGLALVGPVPRGLPAPSWPDLAPGGWGPLLPAAFTIAFVSTFETLSIALAVERHRPGVVRPSRELVALGLANLASGASGSIPIAGGFARTAVLVRAGARSRLAGAVTAVGVAAALLVLAPVLAVLPRAVLAAIVITALGGLVAPGAWRELAGRPADLAVAVASLGATVLSGPVAGLLVGMGAGAAVGLARRASAPAA